MKIGEKAFRNIRNDGVGGSSLSCGTSYLIEIDLRDRFRKPLGIQSGGTTAYLKRMARLIPDFWADEDFILDPENWPPTEFHRSIWNGCLG
jgi:hypothetical protein